MKNIFVISSFTKSENYQQFGDYKIIDSLLLNLVCYCIDCEVTCEAYLGL